jgi:nitrate/TMAO reductase-like tetraheme cytochrome c subunit
LNVASAQDKSADESCFHCHPSQVNEFQESIHFNKNSCADCHGGDINISGNVISINVMHTNFTGKPSPLQVTDFCAKCHPNSTMVYKESIHWEKLKEGRPAASCTDCHGIHNILSPKDSNSSTFATNIAETCAKCHENQTKMQALYFGIRTDRFDTYKKSYHFKSYRSGGKLLATCSDCHENHDTRAQSDPKSAINPANLAATCGKKGCHEGGNNVFLSGGKIHEEQSVYLLSFDAKKIVTYFYIIMILFELTFTFGLIFLGIASKFEIRRRH